MSAAAHARQGRLRVLALAAVGVVVSGCASRSAETTQDYETEPEPIDQVQQPWVNCNEWTDTGYVNGNAYTITLVTVDGEPVEKSCANAYSVMQQAAAADGVKIVVVSGFRTMSEQEYFYHCYTCCCCNSCNQAAKPGYSNHQSGHALDLNTSAAGVLNWLNNHGAYYGFKRTVPSENWHWEWWGGGPGGGPCQTCECNPGETQTQGCGNCGTHSRTCGGDCHWGGWTGCSGQGPCAPGATDSEACCDCGSRSRSCTSNCEWGGWGECAGPDPNGGNDACDTGEPGPCASGTRRCVKGCKACVRNYEPEPEKCDAVDNDCNALVDDGHPLEMGTHPPPLAALLQDVSSPQKLEAGERGVAWATFANVGSETWKRNELWLVDRSGIDGQPGKLRCEAEWPAWDVAAVLDRDVAPGDQASFSWGICAPDLPGTSMTGAFQLMTAAGEMVNCPVSDATLSVAIRAASTLPTPGPSESSNAASDGGCSTARVSRPAAAANGWYLGLAIALLATRRLSRRSRSLP